MSLRAKGSRMSPGVLGDVVVMTTGCQAGGRVGDQPNHVITVKT